MNCGWASRGPSGKRARPETWRRLSRTMRALMPRYSNFGAPETRVTPQRSLRRRFTLGKVLLLGGLLLGSACRSEPEPEWPPEDRLRGGVQLDVGAVWTLPVDWDTMDPVGFEEMVERELPTSRVTPISRASLVELAEGLERQDASSVRAAVILGRSSWPSSASILIRRLEKRVLGPERESDAGDTLCAAALARFPNPKRYAKRMLPLSIGSKPHPDLEVRVECACTALAAGHERVIPFLLMILRLGTWEGQEDVYDFPESQTTAWIRGRAAQALSEHAGVPVTYRTDAPIAEREREARLLAERLIPEQAAK